MIALALAVAAAGIPATVGEVATKAGFAGEILVGRRDRVVLDRGYGTVAPIAGGRRHRAGATWRLASITKQVTAALIVRDTGRNLDQPLGYMGIGSSLRQLLTHHSELANPDETPASADGVPAFYTRPRADMKYCLSEKPRPARDFSYNNCDYLAAAWALPALFRGSSPWPAGMRMARVGEMGIAGFVAGKPEPHYELASFGAAGGLMGSARAVFNFDRKLMTGKLLSPAARAELWKPEGGRSYQALGQWVFPGQLKGCATPKRIVQRDGEIGGVQTRNYILPDDDLAVVVFTNRGPDDFAIGEIWQGKGFAYDLLSAVACS